jgi:voltage-gated potassium channel Kch
MKTVGSFWRTDRGLSGLLVFLFLALLVAPPLLRAQIVPAALFDVLFSLILISGAAVVSDRKWPIALAIGLAAMTLGLRWAHRSGLDWTSLTIVDATLSIASTATLAGFVLFRVLRKGEITMYRVQGAVAAYLLLGLGWASAYDLLFLLRPGAFRFPDANADQLSLLYFSFVTLTTVGYGDITPVLPAARSLAVSEALVGQIFPAVLIARLVSMELASRDRGGTRDDRN